MDQGERDAGAAGSVAPLHADQEGLRACTLEAYAAAKGLPVDFLRALDVTQAKYLDAPAVRIPYSDGDGNEHAVRFRIALDGDDKFRWKKRSKLCLYGLPRLRRAREAGYVVLVEGESCAQTLWLTGLPALGLPGAGNWDESRDAPHLEGIPTVYVVIEPDKGGQTVLTWLAESRIRERVKLVTLDDAGDVSELYLQDRARFAARLEQELQWAIPWEKHARVAAEIRARVAWEKAGPLAREPRILDVLASELDMAGVVGEDRLCKLVYLAVTGRLLERFASLAVKGPSASGKSWAIERVLQFFPPEAYYLLTAMSERSLAYGTEPLKHRFLVFFEAAGLDSDFASYLVRSLLSEGRVRYETVEKTPKGLESRLIEREGPTGLIVTTTSVSLHPENETRLLSLAATDTPDQTRRVLARLARDDDAEPDFTRWHDLQVWLAAGDLRVAIPYAHALAELVPPVAVRLRRDFRALLSLIRSHALLHQESRARDARGRVVATLDDYEVVRELVADVVSEGVEATVPETMREVVTKVQERGSEDGVSITELAKVLGLDKSAASRRWQAARGRGYLRNLEDKRGKPARIVLGDSLPDELDLLPTVELLAECWGVARNTEVIPDPPPVRANLAQTEAITPSTAPPRNASTPPSTPTSSLSPAYGPLAAVRDAVRAEDSDPSPDAWECPCGEDPTEPGTTATHVRTLVALREPVCPFCGRAYKDEYRVEEAPAA
jgi:hypothetical protein